MWMGDAREGQARLQPGLNLQFVVVALSVLTIVFGIVPGLLTDNVQDTAVVAEG